MGSLIATTHLDHVALNVSDVARSAAFYRKLVGARVLHKWDNAWLLRGEHFALGLYIVPHARQIADPATALGMNHFAFLITPHEFAAAQVALKTAGIAFEGPKDTGVALSIFVFDPDGYKVEFTHYKAHSLSGA